MNTCQNCEQKWSGQHYCPKIPWTLTTERTVNLVPPAVDGAFSIPFIEKDAVSYTSKMDIERLKNKKKPNKNWMGIILGLIGVGIGFMW